MLYLDYLKCKKIIKSNSASFYKAFRTVKNKHKRKSIYSVYTFCRLADDFIDEYQDDRGLALFSQELNHFLTHHVHHHFLWNTLRDVFQHYDMNPKPFIDMIEGQKMDQTVHEYETYEQLLEYCYKVASTVGLMITPILAPLQAASLTNCCIKLGYAMQLTNILRDVGEDYQKGRIYLPQDLMESYHYSKMDLHQHLINSSFIQLWEDLAKRAESYYAEAEVDFQLFPDDSRHAIRYSSLFYKAILNACRKANYNVFTEKNFVSDQEKLNLIAEF